MKPITKQRFLELKVLNEKQGGEGVLLWHSERKIKVFVTEIISKEIHGDSVHIVVQFGINPYNQIYFLEHLFEVKPETLWDSIMDTNNDDLIGKALPNKDTLDTMIIKKDKS